MRLDWSAFGLFLLASGCDGDAVAPVVPVTEAPEAPAAVEAPKTEAEAPPRVLASAEKRLAASHILIAWTEAVKAPATVRRTRDEARALADAVHARVTTGGENFAAVAKELSDDSTKKRGGSLGTFNKGTMVPTFEEAALKLAVGEVSPVVESPFGFHIIQRDLMAQVHCAQLIVGFADAARPMEGVTRNRTEAQTRIEAAKAELDGGAAWGTVVRKYSDGPAKDDQGDLGWFSRRQLMPALDEVAMDLDIGATSGVIESPVGLHLLHRLE